MMHSIVSNHKIKNLARYGMFHYCTWCITVVIPSISISQQLIMTQIIMKGAQKSKNVLRMCVENKTKPLITATRQLIPSHESFNYAFFSVVCAIIGHFAILRGDPYTLQMSGVSFDEPQISALNSSIIIHITHVVQTESK